MKSTYYYNYSGTLIILTNWDRRGCGYYNRLMWTRENIIKSPLGTVYAIDFMIFVLYYLYKNELFCENTWVLLEI